MRPQVTETSLAAYERLKAEKKIGKLQRLVFETMVRAGGRTWTGNEINAILARPNQVSPGYHKRLSELVEMGLIVGVGSRRCFVTGEVAAHYAVGTYYTPQISFVFKPTTPTKAQFREAYTVLTALLQQQNLMGRDVGEATDKVVSWLYAKGATKSKK